MYRVSRFKFLIVGLGLCLATSACAEQASAGTVRAASPREPAVFYGTWSENLPGIAVYSASTGRRLKILVPQEPGGGVLQVALAPDGRTIAFTAGDGTCGTDIKSVGTTGGPVQVLVPEGHQHGGTPALAPSYSPDGRYFTYSTLYCDGGATFLHIRNLRTGMTHGYRTGLGTFGLVFLRGDRQAVVQGVAPPASGAYKSAGQHLTVVSLPALAVRRYRPPAGCLFDQVAGTSSRLIAALTCGKRRVLSVVSLSTRTFRVTGTVARLGACLYAYNLSLAGDGAVLVAAEGGPDACPGAARRAEIVAIRGGQPRTILASKGSGLPADVVW
jgi:WD40 repeat protein